MEPRPKLHTIKESELGSDPIARADRFFTEHVGIHKLLVIDDKERLRGLFTLSDIEQITGEAKKTRKASRDSSFRLVVGAAISPVFQPDGSLNITKILDHASWLYENQVDAIAISSAHAHTKVMGELVRLVRKEFKDLTLIAGNVTTAEGVEFLADCGADTVKVGQGPGSICTTRIVAGVGIPQLTALYIASQAAKKRQVRLIADGGINKSGDCVKALTLADAVMCGGVLAGCREAPGKIMEIDGKVYKQYRGMGSEAAMTQGAAARYGYASALVNSAQRKIASEGIEALKEVSGSIDDLLGQLAGGIQAGLGYIGAKNLQELREKARYVRVTSAGLKEARPHNVIEISKKSL